MHINSAFVSPGNTWEIDGTSRAIIAISAAGCGNNLPGLSVKGEMILGAGLIVKNGGAGINVFDGAKLVFNGEPTNKVIFTSYKDDSVGGDTNGDGQSSGAASDYSNAIVVSAGGEMVARDAVIRNASLALDIWDAKAQLSSFTIENVVTGMRVIGNDSRVVYRGAIHNASDKAVRSCDWLTSVCRVNVAFTDWGDAAGPTLKVCGQMISSPWKHDEQIIPSASLFMLNNCGSSIPAPQAQLNNMTVAFSDRRAILESLCGDEGQQDACDALVRKDQCIREGIIPIAETYYGIPMPTRDPAVQAQAYAEDLGGLLTDYVIAADSDTNYAQILDALTKFANTV